MNETPMQLRDASVFYNGNPVLDTLNHAFQANAVTGIIGPSGSGKSTLLRTLSRMNDRIRGFRVEGEIKVAGEDVYANGVDVHRLRRKMGLIFQKPCVFPKSIYENVIFGLKYLAAGEKQKFPEIAERVLREVRLWEEVKDRLHKPAPTLSQGQQQRLAIARTLAVEPGILLMDEPTSALDPRSAQAIEELILSLKDRHAILLVTHNLRQAETVADDLIFLNRGKIIEAGKARELIENPQREDTREFMCCSQMLEKI